MKAGSIALAMLALVLAGCGGGSGDGDTAARATTSTTGTSAAVGVGGGEATGKLPPGSVAPPDVTEEQAEGPAATEATPEAPAEGPRSSGELSGEDRTSALAIVGDYIKALNRHDAARVCNQIAHGGLDLSLLPRRHGGCVSSLRASIGTPPRDGGPAWRKTSLVEATPEDLGDDRARVSATVTHHFADRKYVSVEDDVIYLERAGSRWLLAKPSGTLFRAVGYSSPPLAALRPPAGW